MTLTASPIARIGGVPLHAEGAALSGDELRQRACTELLRQRAQALGLLSHDDVPGDDGSISAAATEAIEVLLERELHVPEPDEAACRRYHAGHPSRYTTGERVRARHVLYAVTPGVDIAQLRKVAEQTLLDLRSEPECFAERAAQQSNCPSGQHGGELGWLLREDCAEEFARELFGQTTLGVLPRLVHSRYGLHVVEVLEREPGEVQPFERVSGAVALALKQQTYVAALRQYLQLLAGEAEVQGVDLDASDSPLVQ